MANDEAAAAAAAVASNTEGATRRSARNAVADVADVNYRGNYHGVNMGSTTGGTLEQNTWDRAGAQHTQIKKKNRKKGEGPKTPVKKKKKKR